MNQTAPKWGDFAAGDDERLNRYTTAPRLARRTYFDQYILPRLSGPPDRVAAVWNDFNAKADASDAADPRRSKVTGRLQATPTSTQALPFGDFVDSSLDGDGTYSRDQYRDDPRVRGEVRRAYFEAVVLPKVPVGQDIGAVRAEFNRRANEIDRAAGRVREDLMPDPAASAARTGLPSLTPANLNTAPGDGSLTDAIARRAGRTIEAEEPGLLEKVWSYVADAPAISGAAGLQRQARKAVPVETQRKLQIQDIARDELAAALTAGGMTPDNAQVLLSSPRGREIVRDTAVQALQQGAKLANQGDATWSRLVGDMVHSADRQVTDSMRKLSYAMLMNNMIDREQAQKFWQSGEDIISRIPEPLSRGFWGDAVVDVAGMAPILAAGGLASAVPGVGPVLGPTLFATEASGGFYHYAIEEVGMPESAATKAAATLAGAVYGAIESLQLGTAMRAGKRNLVPVLQEALKKSSMGIQRKLALKSAGGMTAATAEQMLQEGVQEMVDVLHQEFSDQKGIDWQRVASEGMKAVRESAGASLLMTGGFGLPAHIQHANSLRQADKALKDAVSDVASRSEANRTEAEQKLAVWQQKSDALRARLGLADAPLTTEGGPLPAPTTAPAETPAPEPENAFTIDGQEVAPGLELEGPGGRVTVVSTTPDPETTEMLTVVRNAAGEEVALTAAEMADGGYRPVAKPAQAPKTEKAPAPKQADIDGVTYAQGDVLVDKKSKRWYDVADAFSDGERGWVIATDRKTKERISVPAGELGGYRLRKPKPAVVEKPVPASVPVPTAQQIRTTKAEGPAPLMLPPGPQIAPPRHAIVGGMKLSGENERIYRGTKQYEVRALEYGDRYAPTDPRRKDDVTGVWIRDGKGRYTLVPTAQLEEFGTSPDPNNIGMDATGAAYAPLKWSRKIPAALRPEPQFDATLPAGSKQRNPPPQATDAKDREAARNAEGTAVAKTAPKPRKPRTKKPKASTPAPDPAPTAEKAPAQPPVAQPEPAKAQAAAEAEAVDKASEHLVGRKWKTPFSGTIPQKVVDAEIVAVRDGFAFVKTDPNSNAYERIKLADIEDRIAKEEAATAKFEASRPSVADREAKIAAAAKEKADRLKQVESFVSNAPPMQAGKQRKVLTVYRNFNGQPQAVYDLVEERVAQGAVVVQHQIDKRRLKLPSGEFFTQGQITSTGMDYAEWLVSQREAQPDPLAPTAEVLADYPDLKPKPPVDAAKSALATGTYETAKPDLVALGRQVVADGHDTLPKFTRRIKELLGDAYSKLKGKLGDLWKAVQDESGFLRLPERQKKQGEDNQRGPVRKFARRVLTRDGGKTAAIADLSDLMGGEIREDRFVLDVRARNFQKALKQAFPKGVKTESQLHQIHEALTAETPERAVLAMQALPESLRPAVQAMRETIDTLTRALVDSGAITDPDLLKTIKGNIGRYLTRSYRIFDDKKYLQEVLNAVSYITGQGSGKYGVEVGKRTLAAANYIRSAYTIPDLESLQEMAWPDLLSLGAYRGLAVRGKTKSQVIAELDAMGDRVPSDEWIRQQLTGLLQKARKAGADQAAFRTGRIEGQMDLSSMMRRKDIPEPLRDLMGEHKDPLVNFYRSGLRISQQVAKHRFMSAVVASGLKAGTMYEKPTTGPDPFSPSKTANYDTRMGDANDPTTAPFADIYTTKEIADALARAVKPMQMSAGMRMLAQTNAAVKLGKTVLSVDTTVRNFMGNPYFALMQGHLRAGDMLKAARVAGGQWIKGESLEQTIRTLIREGVIGDSVSASEMSDILRDAAVRADNFESFRATLAEKTLALARGGLNKAQDTYQMMDDIWRVYGYIHEHRRYSAVGKKKGWTDEQIARRAAYVVKNTYPSYSQLPELIHWFRRNPVVAPFVSFPASVARVHYMTLRIATEEWKDPDTKHLGMIRLAGLAAMPLLYMGIQEAAKFLAGMDDDADLAARRLMSPFERDGLLIYLGDPKKTGALDFINLSYTVGGAYLMDPVMSVLRGDQEDEWGKGFAEAIAGLVDPFLAEDLVAAAYMDLSRNKTGRHRPVYNAAESYTLQGKFNIAADVGNFLRERLQPGVGRSAQNLVRGWQGYQNIYGKQYTFGGELARMMTGISPVKRDITGSAIAYAKSYKALMGEAVQVVSNRIRKEDPSDDDIRDAVYSMEINRQLFWARTLDIVESAKTFGKTRQEIRTILNAANFTKEQQRDILSGRYESWEMSGQFMETLEDAIMAGPGGKKGVSELKRRRQVARDYARELKKQDLGILPPSIRRR